MLDFLDTARYELDYCLRNCLIYWNVGYLDVYDAWSYLFIVNFGVRQG